MEHCMKTKEYMNHSTRIQVAEIMLLLNLLFACEELLTATWIVVFSKTQIVFYEVESGVLLGQHWET